VTRSRLARVFLFLVISAFCVLGYLFFLSALRGKLGSFSAALPAMLLAVGALVLNWRFFRLEGGSLAELGFDRPRLRIRQMVLGFVAGCLMVGAWAFVVRVVTSVSWRMAPTFGSAAAVGALTFAVFNNAAEELIYRGYLFLLVARSWGRAVAVIGTSVLFTALHIQGGVPWQNAVAGVLTSALIFAAVFIRWQSVPLVLAFHVAMNFTQELIGLRISGLTFFMPTYGSKVTGAEWHAVLAITGLMNVLVALVVFVSARHSQKKGERNGATGSG
jgi:membrane protease YdiL (CAAX protease family)